MKTTKKGKKTKKSKGGKSKDAWTHEGGVVYDDDTKGQGKVVKKGPRRTQERDERQRRGRLKVLDRLKGDQFRRKMVHKVKFSDVVENDDEPIVETSPTKHRKEPPPPSSKSVMHRLRKFLQPNSRSLRPEEHEDDSESNYSEDDVVGSVDNEDLPDENDVDINQGKLSAMQTDVDEPEQSVDALVELDAIDDAVDEDSPFQAFFNSDEPTSQLSQQPTLLEVEKDFEVIGSLSMSAPNHTQKRARRVRALGDIIGLAKLWRSRKTAVIEDPLESLLLSYLTTYADSMIEGRDYRNDDSILRALVSHAGMHIVKAK